MRDLVRTVSWVLLFAALGAAAASWFTPTPELEADDAAELALDALTQAGVEAELVDAPARGVHQTGDGTSVDAWIVKVAADAGGTTEQIELRVQESAGKLVYVDDRVGADGTDQLLTDEQFDALGEHRDDALADRWTLRNVLAAVTAVVIAGVCFVLATRSDPLWSAP